MKKVILMLAMVLSVLSPIDTSAQLLKKLKDKVEKKVEDKLTYKKETKVEEQEENGQTTTVQSENKGSAKDQNKNESTSYKSKFDFVPGEKLIALDDFSTDEIGDFPAKWSTDGSGEVVTLEGYEGKWLMMKDRSQYYIDELLQLPDNFTIQFDLMCSIPFNWGSGIINFEIKDIVDIDRYRKGDNGGEMSDNNINYTFRMDLHPGIPATTSYGSNGYGHYNMENQHANIDLKESWLPVVEKNLLHVSIWRQKERLRVYLNENKIIDLPKILPTKMKPNLFVLRTEGFEEEDHYFATNLRIAVGNPDTRNKLLTEGKLVTNGILFAVNSDKIKPESYGVLKEIAGILKESNDVKVIIVGHTDSDGDEASNLELSKKRATSVKNALSSDFGIDASRMETDGKGESQPEVPNKDAISKAKNRRVEFIKSN
tara:strand:- start:168 stop:1451 length:1284 start_codon:yes stop_codon:yes gene_type:complete